MLTPEALCFKGVHTKYLLSSTAATVQYQEILEYLKACCLHRHFLLEHEYWCVGTAVLTSSYFIEDAVYISRSGHCSRFS